MIKGGPFGGPPFYFSACCCWDLLLRDRSSSPQLSRLRLVLPDAIFPPSGVLRQPSLAVPLQSVASTRFPRTFFSTSRARHSLAQSVSVRIRQCHLLGFRFNQPFGKLPDLVQRFRIGRVNHHRSQFRLGNLGVWNLDLACAAESSAPWTPGLFRYSVAPVLGASSAMFPSI